MLARCAAPGAGTPFDRIRTVTWSGLLVGLLAASTPFAARASAQDVSPSSPSAPPPAVAPATYVPITPAQRLDWIVGGTIGPRSLGVGVIASAWQTAWNTPEEWGQTWSGAGRRYLAREADVAISNTMEAGFGALWGEDPRYIPSGTRRFKSRVGYVLKMSVLAQHTDGTIRPAWGRYL